VADFEVDRSAAPALVDDEELSVVVVAEKVAADRFRGVTPQLGCVGMRKRAERALEVPDQRRVADAEIAGEGECILTSNGRDVEASDRQGRVDGSLRHEDR